jgi:hypothetical protein
VVNTAVKIALIQSLLFDQAVRRGVIAKGPSVPCSAAFDVPQEECRSESCIGVGKSSKMSKKCSFAKNVYVRSFAEAKQTDVDSLSNTKSVCIAALARAYQQRLNLKNKQARSACSAKAEQIGTTYFVKAKQIHHGGFAKAIQTVALTHFATTKFVDFAPPCAGHDCVDAERIAPRQKAKDRDSNALVRPLSTRQEGALDSKSIYGLTNASKDSFWSNIHSMP